VTFAFRRLGESDIASYREIRLEALKNHPGSFGDSWEAAKDRPDSAFAEAIEQMAVFGAFTESGRIVGLAAFRREQSPKTKHKGDVFQVYVRPETRGTGCGLGLIGSVIDHARPLVAQVRLYVSAENVAAIGLYKQAGFHIYGTEPRALHVNGRYIDEHLMVRFLDKAPGKKNDNA
jgi:ribosomal protein S18 acetylase RimI-like enzyme